MLRDLDWSGFDSSVLFSEDKSRESMWRLIVDLFPIYRALCGPGFLRSLERIRESLDIDIAEFETGSQVHDWTIPPEFSVNEAWAEGPDGKRYFDFDEHPYHLWIYSRPFQGVVGLDELLEHVATDPAMPDHIPLRQTYYRDRWMFSARHAEIAALPPGEYTVNIDTTLNPGKLRIGEYLIEGETDREVLISSYLCHPRGANDNLSGVVVAVELFRLLAGLPNKPHYSYRLALWPETIGAITYLARYPERIARTIGGYQLMICGDSSSFGVDQTFAGDSVFDRAAVHAMRLCGADVLCRPFNVFGGDGNHFNAIGYRVPMANLTRGGAWPDGYKEYHSSADEPGTVVTADNLLETLKVAWNALMTVERARVYRPTFETTPFLEGHGIYPYHHSAGTGTTGTLPSHAYYALMLQLDGERDLLEIAEASGMPIFAFDECVADFKRAGLLTEVGPEA